MLKVLQELTAKQDKLIQNKNKSDAFNKFITPLEQKIQDVDSQIQNLDFVVSEENEDAQ